MFAASGNFWSVQLFLFLSGQKSHKGAGASSSILASMQKWIEVKALESELLYCNFLNWNLQ